ncbi:MAG: hypothetical protein ACKO41_04425 [Sphingomonadales bacterium]
MSLRYEKVFFVSVVTALCCDIGHLFYDLSDSKLIYSAQSQSFDPTSSDNLGREYGKLIVEDIVNKGIIVVSSIPSKGL